MMQHEAYSRAATAARTGHPIRRSIATAVARERAGSADSDLKLFAVSFTAFFVCFYTFLI